MSAEAERVRKRDLDVGLPRLVGHVVEVALRIRVVEVDGRRQQAPIDGEDAGRGLDCARGAEVLSRMLNYHNRGTAVIFGDGAGAAVVRPAPTGAGFRSWCLGSDGRGFAQVTCGNIEKGAYAANDATPYIDMVGPDVFKFAVDIFIRQANEVCNTAGVALEDIDLWVPHQANFRIIDAAARRIGLALERVAINIDEYGNTSSASIPLALEEAIRQGRVKSGDHVLLAGFGSGLTWGATLMTWV